MNPNSPTKRWRILRRCLLGLAAFLTLLAAFYTEENWRGHRAWENGKRAFEARGIKMDWKAYIPAPVPDSENAWAVPEMQKLFMGSGAADFRGRIQDTVFSNITRIRSVRVVVAEVKIGLPGTVPPNGFSILSYDDPQAREDARKLMNEALGPQVKNPWGMLTLKRRLDEIQPAKIWLQCKAMPANNEVERFLPKPSNPEWNQDMAEGGHVEPTGTGSYQVTLAAPSTAADFLAWNAWLEPDLAIIREALKRPYARVEAEYQDSPAEPLPSIAPISQLARNLGALAQCHLLLDQPDEALRDVTLMHDLCRLREVHPGTPFALLSALLQGSVVATGTSVIGDGLALHAWREPQLVALQAQLKELNFVSIMSQVWLKQPARTAHLLEASTPSQLGQILLRLDYLPRKTNAWSEFAASVVGNLLPRGWVYQNMAHCALLYQTISDSLDASALRIYPERAEAARRLERAPASPGTFVVRSAISTLSTRVLDTARVQTMVHEALIACALERYRLAHNTYPESLDALVPQFLDKIPHDIIGGQPLHYRRANDGKFVLYSVGWNGTDDGAKPSSTDDWLWQNGH